MGHDTVELIVDGRRLQIHPADDPDNERIGVRELEQPARFLERLPYLDDHARVEARGIHLVFQILRHEVAADRRHRVVDPVVLGRRVPPEVLVGIDANHLLLVTGYWPFAALVIGCWLLT